MTARSGDALSHVNIQAPSNAILTEIGAGEFWLPAQSATQTDFSPRFGSTRICMAAMSGEPGNEPARSVSFAHYLPKSFHA
jgi:hypothetical protein